MGRVKGEPATPKQKAALMRGQKKRADLLAKASEEWPQTAKQRHRALITGELKVSDLEDEEIRRMRVYGRGKTFSGNGQRLPQKIAREFVKEALKRAADDLRKATPDAVRVLLDIANDPDAPDQVRTRAAMYLIDRNLGKTPDVVRIEGKDEFGSMIETALGAVVRDV